MESRRRERPGLVFNVQKFSTEDGPGIRTTVFMKGCPLRCPWCSNPEGMGRSPELLPSNRNCISCKKCEQVCPPNAISFRKNTREIDWDLCNGCLVCAEQCPSGALEGSGEYKTVDEAFGIVERDRDFYRTSGGGVTVSGGEPLLQWEFVRALFNKCKQAGFHTALDTTGYCSWGNMEQVLEHTDLVLFDVKHTDSSLHKEKTGVPNERILSNLEKAVNMTTVWIRVPVLPGFNDSESNMYRTAELAVRVGAARVSLLPYHDWASEKYNRLGRCYEGGAITGGTGGNDEVVSRWLEILSSHGLSVSERPSGGRVDAGGHHPQLP
ncbi:MAG: glycyl-radical enzyme activating protein [Deltaproteobacteria bacterium]|nr:glycyl-radical enzyme activating protein [Deltaproteobacteria bacterium]